MTATCLPPRRLAGDVSAKTHPPLALLHYELAQARIFKYDAADSLVEKIGKSGLKTQYDCDNLYRLADEIWIGVRLPSPRAIGALARSARKNPAALFSPFRAIISCEAARGQETIGFSPGSLAHLSTPAMPPLDPQLPDGTLVAAVLAGRREAFDLIVERYQRALLFVARGRLSRADLAEDVVQEAFLCALKWLHTYDSKYSFRTWLWTILLNQCSRAAQKIGRQPRVLPSARHAEELQPVADLASSQETPLECLLARESSEQIGQFLDQLPEQQADALRLRFFGGLKFQEIADAQGCSLTSAKTRVRSGLLQLANWLRESESLQKVSGESP